MDLEHTTANANDRSGQSRKISKILLELAENHLLSPENKHFISEEGVEKVRQKLA